MAYQDNFLRELIVDNFAGGGGASVGIELAVGRPVDIAINHDPNAIAMHKVNHPHTIHLLEDVFGVEPEEVTMGRPVAIGWFSPDCKYFSKAKGGRPVDKKIRGLSWVILKWAMSRVAPRVIFMENVEEIQKWGPLIKTSKGDYPDPTKIGDTFNGFLDMLTTGISKEHPAFAEACEFLKLDVNSAAADRLSKGLGYKLDYKILKACDYGAPTSRKRFYLIARNDGQPIVFPEPTHGRGKKPYRAAAECIDWSIPCPSIFGRKKPLVANTLKRIARGIDKFVIKNPRPFIMEMNYNNPAQDPLKPLTTQTTANHHYIIEPHLVQIGYGEREGQKPRVKSLQEPLPTVVASNKHFVCAPYLTKYFSGESQAGADVAKPMPTVTGIDHNAVVVPNFVQYYKTNQSSGGDNPLPTVTTKDRHGLIVSNLCVLRNNMDGKDLQEPIPTITAAAQHEVLVNAYLTKIDGIRDLGKWHEVRKLLNEYGGYNMAEDEILIIEVNGIAYFISDIGMRMLEPRELMLAQGFPVDYVIDIESRTGKKYSKAKQIGRIGNSVCPPVARALVRANCNWMVYKKPLNTVEELEKVIERCS